MAEGIVKERGMICAAHSVRGILAGSKTQTRRVMTPVPRQWPDGSSTYKTKRGYAHLEAHAEYVASLCRHGRTGDRLWVRESFGIQQETVEQARELGEVCYRADGDSAAFLGRYQLWRSPLFMPRWASRIDLEIVSVQVQRLQRITAADVAAEGLSVPDVDYSVVEDPRVLDHERETYARALFRQMWNGLNAKRGFSWDANPWVWRIEFRRLASEGYTPTPTPTPPESRSTPC